MVWYSHLLKNFPQFVVIHTVKGFGIVNKAEIVVFMELNKSLFTYPPSYHPTVSEYLSTKGPVLTC